MGTYLEPIWTLLPEDVVCCVKNRNPIALIFRKTYRFKFYVIKYNPQDPMVSYRTFHICIIFLSNCELEHVQHSKF